MKTAEMTMAGGGWRGENNSPRRRLRRARWRGRLGAETRQMKGTRARVEGEPGECLEEIEGQRTDEMCRNGPKGWHTVCSKD